MTDRDTYQTTELLPPAAVAAIFNVSVDTVRKWDTKGLLVAIRTPGGQRRFRRSDVDALLAGDAA